MNLQYAYVGKYVGSALTYKVVNTLGNMYPPMYSLRLDLFNTDENLEVTSRRCGSPLLPHKGHLFGRGAPQNGQKFGFSV